jgi:Xaa-Pro aminopeptidase
VEQIKEESILLLFQMHLMSIRMIFLKETEHIAIWEGEKLTKERA